MSAAPTKKDAAMEKAQAELAKKREAEAVAKADEMRRDVPPGIEYAPPPGEPRPPVNLYQAVRKAQAQIETVRKNGENPHFKSKYATLDEIWESVKKPLNDAGLIVVCDVYRHDGERLLTTHVIHAESGEEITCTAPIMAQNTGPQAIGSAMTYARRYTLTALLEIVTGDGTDDDGEAAENHNHTQTAKNPSASAAADALGF